MAPMAVLETPAKPKPHADHGTHSGTVQYPILTTDKSFCSFCLTTIKQRNT